MKNKSSDVKTINFNSVPIRDMSGDKVLQLSGNFVVKQLSDYLIETWVNYIECHKCPRGDYCNFTKPHPVHKHKKKEIRCGVKSKYIENTIKVIFQELSADDKNKQEKLLSGVYHLSEFVYIAEQQIGRSLSLSDNYIEFLDGFAPKMMTSIIHLREYLNKAASDIKLVKSLYNKKPILLVEGQSEKFFVEKLKESGFFWFNDLRVETYGGYGNAQPKRIQMLIEGYNDIGYMCFMQGDKDGKDKNSAFNRLLKQKLINEENLFLFKYERPLHN